MSYYLTHTCGGTILMGPMTDDGRQHYCDRCGAFSHGEDADEDMPTGTDSAANRDAYDAGDIRSPDDE